MKRQSKNIECPQRVLIVHRKSLYQLYVKDHHLRPFQKALREGDEVTAAIKHSHDTQQTSLAEVQRVCAAQGMNVTVRWRANLRAIRGYDLVISLGGDGTFLDTARRILDDTPLLGVNSDPQRSIGSLCCGTMKSLPWLLERWRAGQLKPQQISRLRVRVDGQEVLGPVLNDVLFAHVSPAQMSRFDIAVCPSTSALRRHSAHQRRFFTQLRSSGIWVSTAIGSSAAIHSAGGQLMPPRSSKFQYLVREPFFPPGATLPQLLRGIVKTGQALVMISRMRRAMIWADGGHRIKALQYSQQIVIDHHPQGLSMIYAPTARSEA